MYYKTADLCDNNRDKRIQVLSSEFKSYGGRVGFHGRVLTLKLNRSNFDLITMLKNEDGEGIVLVIDVDKSYWGVVGDKLSNLAAKNNYEAMIINGYVRDTDVTQKIHVGLYALGTCPLRNFESTESQRDVPVTFGGITFNNGDYIYADIDGILVCSEELNTENSQIMHNPAGIFALGNII